MAGNDPDSEDIEALRRAIVRLALEALEEQPNRALPVEIRPETLERLIGHWKTELGLLANGLNDRTDRLGEHLRSELRSLTNSVDDSGTQLRGLEHAFVQQSAQLKNIQLAVRALAKEAGLKIKALDVEPTIHIQQIGTSGAPMAAGRHPARSPALREGQNGTDFVGRIGNLFQSRWLLVVVGIAAALLLVAYVGGSWPFSSEVAPQRQDDFGITIERQPQESGAESENDFMSQPANRAGETGLPGEVNPGAAAKPGPEER